MTLLDILFQQGKLPKLDYERYRGVAESQLGAKLLADGKISDDELLQAYSELLKLPVVDVANTSISWSVFKEWPIEQIEQLRALPYDATARKLKVAASEPSWLKSQHGALEGLSAQVELALTTGVSFDEVVRRAKIPRLNLGNVAIPRAIAQRFPKMVAEQHRAVAYGLTGSVIQLATDEPLNPKLWELIEFIEDKNQMTVELGRVERGDLDRLLESYGVDTPVSGPPPTVAPAPVMAPVRAAVAQSDWQPTNPTPVAKGKLTIERVEKLGGKEPPVTGSQPLATSQPTSPPTPPSQTVTPPVVSPGPPPPLPKVADENDLGSMLERPIKSPEDLEAVFREGFIPKIVAAIVSFGINNRASDAHLEIGREAMRIRFRIDGILHEIVQVPSSLHPPIVSRIKILGKMKIDETRVPQDGRFDVRLGEKEVDLRLSSLPTVYGEKIVMRLLDKSGGIKDIEKLGIEGRGRALLLEETAKPNGIILVTGPTGSGKSTTLYAVLNKVSTEGVNIITLEDPVEYELSGINQVQVKPKIGFTFAEGLRSVLRQDPNIIMVGEIRDAETASLATHAALTGHLVLSTLHTNDAAGALPRLINMGIEPFLITSAMNLVVAQRLVRKLCEKCKKEGTLPNEVVTEVKQTLEAIVAPEEKQRIGELKFYEAKGCPECSGGYLGRFGIYEVMRVSEAIEGAAVAKKPASEIELIAHKEGMISMRQDGYLKAIQGLTTIDEVLRETGKE